MSRKADNEYLSERDKAIQKQMFMLKRKLTELKLILSEEVSDDSDDNDDSTPIQGEQPSVPCAITNLPLVKIMNVLFYIDKLQALTSTTERIKWDLWNDSPFAIAVLERFDLSGHKWDLPKIRNQVKTYFDKWAKRCRYVEVEVKLEL